MQIGLTLPGVEGISFAVDVKNAVALMADAKAAAAQWRQSGSKEPPPYLRRSVPEGYKVEEYLLSKQILSLILPEHWTSSWNYSSISLSDGIRATGDFERGQIPFCPTASFYAEGVFQGWYQYQLEPVTDASMLNGYDAIKATYKYIGFQPHMKGVALFVRGPDWCLRAMLKVAEPYWSDYEEVFNTIIDGIMIGDQ